MMTVFAKKRKRVDRDVCRRKRKLESFKVPRLAIHRVTLLSPKLTLLV